MSSFMVQNVQCGLVLAAVLATDNAQSRKDSVEGLESLDLSDMEMVQR